MGALSGKISIVTGAGTGVGKGIAYALAKEGVTIVVVGRTEARLRETVAEIEGFGGKAVAIQADVCLLADIERVVAETIAQFGTVDILVNNAQITPMANILDLTPEAFESAYRSGPFATFYFMKACHPHMKANGGGVIINTGTSQAVQSNTAGFAAYVSAKQAIRALTRAAACEWGRDNIRINTVMPAAWSEALLDMIPDEEEQKKFAEAETLLGYIGDCEQDIGRAVVALCGEDCRYITGASIPLDGGSGNFG